MEYFRADLHIHTLLSPCASLEMSPVNIVSQACEKSIDIIAITDHNHTAHNRLTRKIAEEKGIYVLYGAEINSAEEVHCLAYFESIEQVEYLQDFIDRWIPKISNKPELMGYQPVIDENELIIKEIEHSLYAGIDRHIEDICDEIHRLGGLFVPAHINRARNSIYSQIGLFPAGLQPDAIEISFSSDPRELVALHPELQQYTLIKGSDAHYPDDIGRSGVLLKMENISFNEIKEALNCTHGREAIML